MQAESKCWAALPLPTASVTVPMVSMLVYQETLLSTPALDSKQPPRLPADLPCHLSQMCEK